MAASAVPRYRMICSTAVNTSSHPTLSQNSIAAAQPAWSDVLRVPYSNPAKEKANG